jgi:hypothetical protein
VPTCISGLPQRVGAGNNIAVDVILHQSQYYGSDIAMNNIKTVDLNLLIVLDALLDERNVTRAAARLGYTQPTISGMLARLRDLLGGTHSARRAGDTAGTGAGRSVEAIARRQPASRRTQRIRSSQR